MIITTVNAEQLNALERLDAWYFLAPGAAASRRIQNAKAKGLETVAIGGESGLGKVWQPSRFKRAYALRGEESIPYCSPHDVLQYLPDDTERLSLHRTRNLDRYRIDRGTILQTCSGRNLGPSVIVDNCLAGFALSHDMLRIEIDDERMRYYTLAFLHSLTGQGLLRRDKSGSVIDHITVGHVESQEVPLLATHTIDLASQLMQEAFTLIEEARTTLAAALADYDAALPQATRDPVSRTGWTVPADSFVDRLDAAPHDPWVQAIRDELLAAGGVAVSEVAEVRKPAGRYKTIYVTRAFGRPFMSGTQILQLIESKPQYMAERAFNEVSNYELRQGWTVYQADGRAEKDLGVVAMISSDRDGWLASGHVGRLVPLPGTNPGWLWLAARTSHAQAQIKALASGSVVDSTFPWDMESVILPPPNSADGDEVSAAWEKFATARGKEAEAVCLVDDELAMISGVSSGELAADDVVDQLDEMSH